MQTEYIVYPHDIALSFNPNCKEDALHILLQDKEYLNWIVSIFDISVTKSGDLQYNYEVVSIPKHVDDSKIDISRDDLSILLTDILLDIFDRLATQKRNNDNNSLHDTSTTDE